MKKLLLLFAFAASCITVNAQLSYSDNIPANPYNLNTYNVTETVMYNNDVYQVFEATASTLQVTKYDSKTGLWSNVDSYVNAGNVRYRSIIIADNWYIVDAGFSDTKVFKFNFTSQDLSLCTGSLPWVPEPNWVIKSDGSGSDFYLLNVSNNVDVNLSIFSVASETFNGYTYSSWLNPSLLDITGDKLELYISNTDIYAGVSGITHRLVRASLSNVSVPAYYNTNGTNDGYIRTNNAPITGGKFFYLTGNGQTEPFITVQDATNYRGYEELLSDVDVNINTSTATVNTFYTSQQDHEAMEHPAYAFLTSPFSAVNDGTNFDKFYIYRKDNGTNVWDSIGPKIEPGLYDLTPNTLRLSLENSNQQHILVNYASTDGEYYFKVLNNDPSIIAASQTPSSGMCGGHVNLIYPQLEIEDADIDQIRILSVTSTNGNVTNGYAIPIGVDNASSPGLSKFAIYGYVNVQGNTQIVITYTDGFNLYNVTLNTINITGTAPSIIFDSALSHLCDNENNISLADYVNYYDNGVFKINGQIIPNGMLNGQYWGTYQPSGSLTYDANVDGCLVSTGTTYNFVVAGTAAGSTTPATCGMTDGTATVIYTQGTSSNITVEWSTGENGLTISNLEPGAYYYHVTDEYNCHVTGFAGVETIAIDVTETITNVSCNGLSDGSISVNVFGPANYSVIWSNGYSSNSISNLVAGQYWVTVADASNGCEVTYNYTVTEPAAITAFFSEDEPTCSLADGSIYGIFGGGTGAFTYDWIGTGQTTPDLYNVTSGIYEVVITDAASCQKTFRHNLNDEQALEIDETVYPSRCDYTTGAIQLILDVDPDGGTSAPNSVTWDNGYVGDIIGSLGPGFYTVQVSNMETTPPFNTCISRKTIEVPLKAPAIQPICIVTVDSLTTTNLVIWERTETYGIDHYNIYRENTEAGVFSLIDTVHFANESIFNDVVASPMDRSWRYRISQVDLCGTESPLSPLHKTLHLNAIEDVGNALYNVHWDEYEGFIDAFEYVVWRYTDQNDWEELFPHYAVGTSTMNDIPPAGSTGIDYFVEMQATSTCTAEKIQDFNTTRSNKGKGNFVVGQGTGDSNNELGELTFQYTLYPNPFDDVLFLVTETGAIGNVIHVYSLDGKEQTSIVINNEKMKLDLESLSQGVYMIRIDGSNVPQKIIRN